MNKQLDKIAGKLNQRLFENHRADTKLFSRLTELQHEFGLVYGTRPTCPFLRPLLMTRSLYLSVARAAEFIATAAERVAAAALDDDHLLAELGLSEREAWLARIDPGYETLAVTSRLDAFICGENFKFLEYNAESPAGVGDQMQLEKVFSQIPEIRAFLGAHSHWRPRPHQKLLQALFKTYREFGGGKSKPNIAIVDWEGVSTESEFHILSDYFESMGFPTLIVDPGELEYNGRRLNAGSFEVDICYKRVAIQELLDKFDDSHALIRAYAAGAVCLANSFRVKLAHKKMLFAIFTDKKYKSLFSADQISAISAHIPWTRRVRDEKTKYQDKEIDLPEFLRKNREKFLLKPNDEYGGRGITIGWESTPAEWEQGLNRALEDCFVVQERAPTEKQVFPVFSESAELSEFIVDLDPFLFLNQTEGGLVRLGSAPVVNVSQGGGQSALIVMEEF